MSLDPLPKISAIVPIYGKMGDLEPLLNNLNRQTLKPHEILVLDSSPKPLESPPPAARFIQNPQDIDLACDLNRGAKHATGHYLLVVQQECVTESHRAIHE